MRVAIDGPAGSGKSTVAHALAERCGLTLLDTGAMYRAVTLACHERGLAVDDAEAVSKLAREVGIAFGVDSDGAQTVSLDGKDVTAAIRTAEVDADVSAVSAIPAVREAMVELQRKLGAEGDVVAEGRDIGTVVFPDAEVKVFLTADPKARAHRRAVQRAGGDAATDPSATASPEAEIAILEDLRRRDEADSTREVSPLRPAENAVHIDSSELTLEEEVAQISELVAKARAKVEGESRAEVKTSESEAQPKAEAEVEPSGKAKPKKDSDEGTKDGPLHMFGHNSLDDYYEHTVREFPLSSRALLAATVGVCGLLSKVLWPWRIENGERLWNAEGGRMVVMNHVSMLDPVVLVVSDWAHGRRMRPIYKSEFDKHRIVTWFFARVGAIPVNRGTADIKAVRRAQRALQRGEDVLVFPEGTRIHSDEQEVEVHGGFALMAQLAKVPVVPVAIVGARDGAPGGNKPLRPHRVFMRVGEPATFDGLGVKGRKKQAKAMEALAMERVYALRDALRDEHPGKM